MVATNEMRIVTERKANILNLISNKRASRRATHIGGGLVLGIQPRTAPGSLLLNSIVVLVVVFF
jgi:hypothetical protein